MQPRNLQISIKYVVPQYDDNPFILVIVTIIGDILPSRRFIYAPVSFDYQ